MDEKERKEDNAIKTIAKDSHVMQGILEKTM